MKTLLWLAISLLSFRIAYSTTYYFSSSGNDSSDGRSPSSPFRTIAKANTLVLSAGDSLLFKKGDTLRGMLVVRYSGNSSSPIYIGAYGTGAKPVLSGAEVLKDWTQGADNQFTAICDSCSSILTQLFVGDKLHIPARYPNSGYLPMTNVTTTSFSANDLQEPSGTWDSAYFFARTQHWVIDQFRVISYSPGKINYGNTPHLHTSYPLQEHYGFFLTGKLRCLDAPGELFYEGRLKRISLVPLDIPTLQVKGAEVPVRANVVQFARGVHHVVLQDLQIEKSLQDAIFMSSTSNVAIADCFIRHAGRDGVGGFQNYNTTNSYVSILRCTIEDVANTGIDLFLGNHILIQDNTVKRCGLVPGMGIGADSGYEGIYCPANSKVIHNVVDSVGYNAIVITKNDTVMYNQCSNYGLTKNDCGGIYYWTGSNNYISHNFTTKGYGNGQGTVYPDKVMVSGIYSDDHSEHNTIEYNTCSQCECGIILHNTATTQVAHNIAYDNWKTQIFLNEGNPKISPENVMQGNTVTGNVFQCLHPSQRTLLILTEKNNVSTMGAFDRNWHCNPYEEEVIGLAWTPQYIAANYTPQYASRTLAQWKELYGQDLNSGAAYDYPTRYAIYQFSGVNLVRNGSFASSTTGWWTYGNDDFLLAIDEQNAQMTGRAMLAAYSNVQTLGLGNWGYSPFTVQKGQEYLLAYSINGEKEGGLQVKLTGSEAPYSMNMLPSVVQKSFSKIRKEDTLLFSTNYDISSSLAFNSSSSDGNFWMDNVTIRKVLADTSHSLPHSSTVLFVNPTFSTLPLSVAGNYRHLNGSLVASDTVLAPFTSMVLKSASIIPTDISKDDIASAKAVLLLFPNPVKDSFSILQMESQGELSIYDLKGIEMYKKRYKGENIFVPSQWQNGLYTVVFRTDKTSTSFKLILNR